MQKIYVLLRHDQQTGPYSLQELVQFDLKPYDLIWIEGQSAGWYYPQEIAALHPYLRFLPKKPAPAAPLPPAEKKAAVQKPAVAETPPATLAPQETTGPLFTAARGSFAPASENLEEAVYAQFRKPVAEKDPAIAPAYSSQQRKPPGTVVVGISTVLIVGGVFALSWVMNRNPNEDDTTTGVATEAPVQNEITPPAVANEENTKTKQAGLSLHKNGSKKQNRTLQTSAGANRDPSKKKVVAQVSEPAAETADDRTTTPAEPETDKPQSSSASAPEETAAPQEKKKSLKDKFLDLFRKKPDEPKAEEGRPAETENGERVATRRETNLVQMVHLRFDVPNNWMMGIKGAKATLVNRSPEKIKTAAVEVLYYNDDDELLQKKVVTFGKINAKESGTLSIPDHATATKVDYRVLSVTAAGQPPA